MGTKPKKSAAKAVKKMIQEKAAEVAMLPPMPKIKREMNMDNVLVEVFWKPDTEGQPHVAPHLRGVECSKVVACGPLVNNKNIIKGAKIELAGRGTELDRDEVSALVVVKPHDILYFIK
jgi:hypothetical protein